MKVVRETSQSMQRVRVGLIGLCVVVLLIALTSILMGSATRDRGGAADPVRPDGMTNMAAVNQSAEMTVGEPLAEMGVAPSANTHAASPAQ